MASFEFRLGRLRRVRDIQETEARNLWAAAEEVARNHQEVVEHIEDEISKARLDLGRAQVEEALDVGSVLHTHDLIAHLEDRLQRAREYAKTSRFQADELQNSWRSAKSDARALDATIPRSLSRVLARCLEKEPDDRFSSAGELAQALRGATPASGW